MGLDVLTSVAPESAAGGTAAAPWEVLTAQIFDATTQAAGAGNFVEIEAGAIASTFTTGVLKIAGSTITLITLVRSCCINRGRYSRCSRVDQ
jgi:hypothetical protein